MMQTVCGVDGRVGGGGKVGNKVAIRMSVSWGENNKGWRGGKEGREGGRKEVGSEGRDEGGEDEGEDSGINT